MVEAIKMKFGEESVVACDIDELDVRDFLKFDEIVRTNKVHTIIHLAAILPQVGEKDPELALSVNVDGSLNALKVAKAHDCKIFIASSLGVFGGEVFQKDMTPVDCVLQPQTIYGVTKAHVE
jgi:nucleoside-diphosphate-sugar epimerase